MSTDNGMLREREGERERETSVEILNGCERYFLLRALQEREGVTEDAPKRARGRTMLFRRNKSMRNIGYPGFGRRRDKKGLLPLIVGRRHTILSGHRAFAR